MAWTALHSAARHGDASSVTTLLAQSADLHATNVAGATPLHEAAKSGDVVITDMLIKQRGNVGACDSSGQTPLYVGALAGHPSIVRTLAASQADPNTRNSRGQSALHAAAFVGHTAVLRALLLCGADREAKNALGQTALEVAKGLENSSAAEILELGACQIQAITPRTHDEARQSRADGMRKRPLHFAARSGEVAAVGALIASGNSVHVTDASGETALQKVVGVCREANPNAAPIVQLMVDRGADVHKKDACGESLLHTAATNGQLDAIRVLVAHRAEVNVRNRRGQTPLHKAAERGHADIIELLQACDADMHARDNMGRTALDRSHWLSRATAVHFMERGVHHGDPLKSTRNHVLASQVKTLRNMQREKPPLLAGELRVQEKSAPPEPFEPWSPDMAQQLGLAHPMFNLLANYCEERAKGEWSCCDKLLVQRMRAVPLRDLAAAMQDDRPSFRRHAAIALGHLVGQGHEEGFDVTGVLEAALRTDASWEVRADAAESLSKVPGRTDDFRRRLLILLSCLDQDSNATVQSSCRSSLQTLFATAEIPDLLRAVADDNSIIRKYATLGLGVKGAEKPKRVSWHVLSPLENALRNDKCWQVRLQAAESLREFGSADPLNVGLGIVSVLADFLTEEMMTIAIRKAHKDPKEVELAYEVEKACRQAIQHLDLCCTFMIWRDMALQSARARPQKKA